jgi:putative flavoprotein involved in K+ transport
VASGLTTGKADLLFASIPYKVLPSMQKQVFDKIRERDADFYRRSKRPASCSISATTIRACS